MNLSGKLRYYLSHLNDPVKGTQMKYYRQLTSEQRCQISGLRKAEFEAPTRKKMQKIQKQEYTTEFKERAAKQVKERRSGKELDLVEKTLRNSVGRQAHWRGYQASHTGTNGLIPATY